MTTLREAAEQALNFLDNCDLADSFNPPTSQWGLELREALRTALAEQPEQDLIPPGDLFVCGQMGANVTRVRVEQPEPVAWTPISEPYEQGDELDILLSDGSVLCAVLPQFDGDGSMRAMRERIIENRKHTWLSKEDARALWDALKDCEEWATSSQDDWVRALGDAAQSLRLDRKPDAAELLSEPWEYIQTRPKPCAVNFWRTLWPLFIAELRRETETAACAA